MAVNDERMLPKRVRKMYQMEDLLQAEQFILNTILGIINDMISEAATINSLPMTKVNTEYIATMVSNNPSTVREYSDGVTIDILVSRNSGQQTNLPKLRKYLNDLIPAHLKFNIYYVYKTIIGINVKRKFYRYSLDLCGSGYAGEEPYTSTVGKVVQEGTLVAHDASGYIIHHDMTGEYPYLSTVGIVKSEVAELSHRLQAFKVIKEMPGEMLAGEEPVLSTAGFLAEQKIEIMEKGSAYIVYHKLAGEHPNVSTAGCQTESMVSPQVKATAFHYELQFCSDDDYCGEE